MAREKDDCLFSFLPKIIQGELALPIAIGMAREKDDCLFSFLPKIIQGELAHLARALAWHARGDRFDSGILHQKKNLT
jgi:hypothetical protein